MNETATRTYKNKQWHGRDYETGNLVACVASAAPVKGDGAEIEWEPCSRMVLNGLTMLYRQAGVEYWGYL